MHLILKKTGLTFIFTFLLSFSLLHIKNFFLLKKILLKIYLNAFKTAFFRVGWIKINYA
tara:strand:+ start:12881 stop:13057 length:177 start_codon:yes stop_codon:yes gene_type:complete